MAESEELKSLLMKVKEENDEVGLKLNIQKTNIMASGPNTSWQIDPDGMCLSMLQKLAMDKKAWLAAVHRVTKTQTRLSDWTDVWEDGSLWTHWIHSFHMHVSYLGPILFPCSPCFLHSSSFSAITMGGWQHCWIAVGELTFIYEGQKSVMAVTFLVY